jgi:hypothetical protein
MSWSVSAAGLPAEVKSALEEQFKYPLAPGQEGLSDAGEKETVHRVKELVEQALRTFDPEQRVAVTAYGHMGYSKDYATKDGAYQNVYLTISPAAAVQP